MFEVDKQAFGVFLAERRKAKGYTQKELAEKLYVSDKAVSKWERGLSLPDVSLLVPLAGLLGVTVTELLEGRRLEAAAPMQPEEVETIVQKAIGFTEQPPEQTPAQARRRFVRYGAVCVVSLLACFWANSVCAQDKNAAVGLWFAVVMAVCVGWISRFGLPERLPRYYDDNKINSFSDGFFRINLAGAVCFNNNNWSHILRAIRLWSVIAPLLLPSVGALFAYLTNKTGVDFSHYIFLPYIGCLFLPLLYVGKKYEYGAPKPKSE